MKRPASARAELFDGRPSGTKFVRSLPASARRDVGEAFAYQVLPGIVGNQDYGGSLGHDFDVRVPIEVHALGSVRQRNRRWIKPTLTAEVWRRGNNRPDKLVAMTFTPEDAGELIGGSRFKPLPEPLLLPPGQYSMIAHGYGPEELAYNTGTDPIMKRRKAANSGGGAIAFVGALALRRGRSISHSPGRQRRHPSRYGAGTFAFRTVKRATP